MSFLDKLFGRRPEAARSNAPTQARPPNQATVAPPPDWRTSPVHLFALERFLDPREASAALGDHWATHLKQPAQDVIDRFVAAGALEPVPLVRTLEYIHSAAALKALVKERALKSSGNKKDLAERLMQADAAGMAKLCENRRVLTCSAEARDLVERFLGKLQIDLQRCVQELRVALESGDYSAAMRTAGAFLDAEPVRPQPFSPLSIEERPRSSEAVVAKLQSIYRARPPLLKCVSDDDMREIATVTAIGYLLKRGAPVAWLRDSFQGEPSLHHEVTLRMMYFHLNHLHEVERMRATGVRKVKVLSAGGCEACQAIADKTTSIDQAPVLPYEHCTCNMGCRCVLTAVVSFGSK